MVAGTHGKTTTSTAMKVVLGTAGLNPSWIIGVDHGSSEAGGHFGDGAHVVVEADEADRSFLNYRPYVSIITNIRADHVNNYRDLDELQETFLRFALRTRRDGFTVLSADDERCRELADALRAATRRVFTFGVSDDADLRIAEVASTSESASYNAFLGQRALGRVSIALPGRHIAHNSAAVLLSALRLGIPDEITLEGLRQFSGTRRRFEHTGKRGGVRFFDEYAFHPVSMNAALATLREIASPGRLIVVFEPLRLYRAIRFREEIAKELSAVDHLVVKDVYDPAAGLSERREMGQRLQEAVDLPVDAKHFIADDDQIIRHVHGVAVEGDLVVTMGAHPLSLLNRRLLAE